MRYFCTVVGEIMMLSWPVWQVLEADRRFQQGRMYGGETMTTSTAPIYGHAILVRSSFGLLDHLFILHTTKGSHCCLPTDLQNTAFSNGPYSDGCREVHE